MLREPGVKSFEEVFIDSVFLRRVDALISGGGVQVIVVCYFNVG